MDNVDRFKAYLSAYARKDLHGVGEMFAEEVDLCDWNISVQGRDAALDETAKNFAAAQTIQIEVLRFLGSAETVAAELEIVIDERILLRVVDVVSFDRAGKILSIRAYLGRTESLSPNR